MQKKVLITTTVIVAVFVGIYLFGLKTGKGKGRIVVPIDQDGIRPGFNVEGLVSKLRNAIAGWKPTYIKREAFSEYFDTTDGEMAAVYNRYNEKYLSTKPEESLYTDIAGEWIWGDGMTQLLQRMERLGLT